MSLPEWTILPFAAQYAKVRYEPEAALNTKGGKLTFAAGAQYDWVNGDSRHSNGNGFEILSAVRKAAPSPMYVPAAVRKSSIARLQEVADMYPAFESA